MAFTAKEIEQAKLISDLVTAMGNSLKNNGNPKLKALGEALANSGDIGGILSDFASMAESTEDIASVLDSAAKVSAGMLGTVAGVAALEALITMSVPFALGIGALTTVYPIVGTLALGGFLYGAGWAGSKAAEGIYGLSKLAASDWSKQAARTVYTFMKLNPASLPENFDINRPPVLELDVTYVNGHYDGYNIEEGTQRFIDNYQRGLDRGFLQQAQNQINNFNFSLSSLIKPGDDFLHYDKNGLLQWNGGYNALQDYAFNRGGLDLSGSDSWQSAFNEKLTNLVDSARNMEEFINNNYGRANEALAGQASALADRAGETSSIIQDALAELTPLAFDLSGNGIGTRSIFDGIKGFEFIPGEKGAYHGWLDANSGFLALDRNGNGTIDDGTELFGGPTEDGFTALRRLDSNGDGHIDASDELFEKLLVWQDTNQNAISDEGELKTLRDAGIKSISLNDVESTHRPDMNGNTIKWISEYTLESGETREIADVYFSYSKPASAVSDKPTTNSSIDPVVEQQTQMLISSMAAFSPSAGGEALQSTNPSEPLNVQLAVI